MATPRICSVDDCDKPAKARGLCDMHYARWSRHGHLDRVRKRNICSIEGCGAPAYGRGWCSAHYQRWARHGDPTAGRISEGNPAAWLNEHLNKESDECFIWPFARNAAGYAVMHSTEGTRIVSRIVCEQEYGPAPFPDADTAHSCNNPGCCNKNHVRWDTRTGNMADAIAIGHTLRGTKHPLAKLTEDDVREIRRLDLFATRTVIADIFGVSRATVRNIVERTRWGWLD